MLIYVVINNNIEDDGKVIRQYRIGIRWLKIMKSHEKLIETRKQKL